MPVCPLFLGDVPSSHLSPTPPPPHTHVSPVLCGLRSACPHLRPRLRSLGASALAPSGPLCQTPPASFPTLSLLSPVAPLCLLCPSVKLLFGSFPSKCFSFQCLCHSVCLPSFAFRCCSVRPPEPVFIYLLPQSFLRGHLSWCL